MIGPDEAIPKQMYASVVALPSSWKTPFESSTPPPGVESCATAKGLPHVSATAAKTTAPGSEIKNRFVKLTSFLL
jgi:hypothetical protein